jgi:hypothetical protein
MSKTCNVMTMGASYGSLLGAKPDARVEHERVDRAKVK